MDEFEKADKQAHAIAEYWEGHPKPLKEPSTLKETFDHARDLMEWENKFPLGIPPGPPEAPSVPQPAFPGAGMPAARIGDMTDHGAAIQSAAIGGSKKVVIGGKPAAAIYDLQQCPMFSGSKAHVGGRILEGSDSVNIGGRRAARISDRTICTSEPGAIVTGEPTVVIGGFKKTGLTKPEFLDPSDWADWLGLAVDVAGAVPEVLALELPFGAALFLTGAGMMMTIVGPWVDMYQAVQVSYTAARSRGILEGLFFFEDQFYTGRREPRLRVDWRKVWNDPDFQTHVNWQIISPLDADDVKDRMKQGVQEDEKGVNELNDYVERKHDRDSRQRLRSQGKSEEEIDDYMKSDVNQEKLHQERLNEFLKQRQGIYDNVPPKARPTNRRAPGIGFR